MNRIWRNGGRILVTVAYDGRPFEGWQSQPGGNTVQDHLQRAIGATTGCKTVVHGAGRTDAGVHALGQTAHFDAPDARLTPGQWVAALNTRLPREIRVLRAVRVSAAFHARFSASGKTYRYRIRNAPVLPPHELHRTWHVPAAMNLEALRYGARAFEGRHDFSAFAANRGRKAENTVRTLREVRVRRSGSLVELTCIGDGFLYRMVRLIVGALVQCATGRMDLAELAQLLDAPAGRRCSHCAPPDGLWLLRVHYPRAVSGERRH